MDSTFFKHIRTIAIVGLSDKPKRPSYSVGTYLRSKGFTIVPVNPTISAWHDLVSYPSISAVPKSIHIDVVDVFRKSAEVAGIVNEVIERGGIQMVWLQEGISDPEAEDRARKSGVHLVSNMCIMKTHQATTSFTNL